LSQQLTHVNEAIAVIVYFYSSPMEML